VDKPWLNSYPQGVPEEIDLSAFDSIVDIFRKSCAEHGGQTAFINEGTPLTYDRLDALSDAFAAWLQSRGLNKGDRVALMLPNLLQYPVAIFGILKAGMVVVNTNPLYTERELRHQLKDSGARAVVILEHTAHVLQKVLDHNPGEVQLDCIVTTDLGEMHPWPKKILINALTKYIKMKVPEWRLENVVTFSDVLERGAQLDLEQPGTGHDDLAFLQYTGGTTGVAKGAMLTHRNLIANMLQSRVWMAPSGIGEDTETIITALPLYHIFALTANCLVFIALGGINVLVTDPRNMPRFVKILSRNPFTVITGVNTLFNGLLNTEGFSDLDFSGLKGALGGGMAVQKAVAQHWREVTGTVLIEAYGLTETSPAACINPMDLEDYNGSIGLPISSTECAIMGENDKFLPPGETGELVIRGPQVMKGYWQRPEETAKVITADGWLRTGDVALMTPEGYFKIVDRKKDMILVSGFNVYPNEIEDVIALHPKVLEVAAIGVPDEKSGEVVKICIVRSDPSLTEKELREYCREQFTGYKQPRIIEFFDDLPKSNVGKILRRELRNMHGTA
jgi:long-chain acyl-CoA synthetase